MIKINLRKADDSIKCSILESMMKGLGFSEQFFRWVMTCVTTISYIVFINGFPTPIFQEKKRLRQGDPMYPFLFTIGMEYWTRCLATLVGDQRFIFHPKCKRTNNISFLFMNDLLVFCKANNSTIEAVKEKLEAFSATSDLCANLEKSEIYFGGIEEHIQF